MKDIFNFNKDIKESAEQMQKLGLSFGGMALLDEDSIYDVIWQKFKTNNWFIILVPSSVDYLRIPYQIEMTFYPPKTPKKCWI